MAIENLRMNEVNISVIVCTFNGKNRLKKTLSHLLSQQVANSLSWEVILADNGSTDDTIAFSTDLWNEASVSGIPLHIIRESRPGKLYALQRAISAATYEYIIVCDDDNWLAPDYLHRVQQLFVKMPNVAALGGYGIPASATLPDWFSNYPYAYAVGPQASQTGYLHPRKYLWGAGMAFRKSVYIQMYESTPSLLPEFKEANILSAEDTEFCLRLQLKGHSLYYDAALIYEHEITPERLTIEYRDKLLKGFSDSNVILSIYHAALRVKIKTKGKPHIWLYLLISASWNALFNVKKEKQAKATSTLHFLFPSIKSKNHILQAIKTFISQK